jgi:TrmH family RNA methyltransferase
VVTSRDNPLVVQLRKQRRDPSAYRHGGGLWLEGEHLCEAWRHRHGAPSRVVLRASAVGRSARLEALAAAADQRIELADALFDEVSVLESPADIAYWVSAPPTATVQAGRNTLVLDRLQDPGNAGTLLRTAAAMGFSQVIALAGTVALWSPKVLRAGMGAHFGLDLVEGLAEDALDALGVPLVATLPDAAAPVWSARLPWPCAWVLGHEGRGIAPSLLARCGWKVAIPQPGGEESLNVASAGAICLYESVRQQAATAAGGQ